MKAQVSKETRTAGRKQKEETGDMEGEGEVQREQKIDMYEYGQ